MEHFKKIDPTDIENVFRLIGKDWMLITAKGSVDGSEVVNTMTASWGGMGVLWNKPVCFCFIRPQRYTFRLTEQADRFSLSFLTEDYRKSLRICGTESRRYRDKFKKGGLTPAEENGVPFVGEARMVLLCRKLYADNLKKEGFLLPALLDNYKDDDFHRVYVCEIEAAYLRESENA